LRSCGDLVPRAGRDEDRIAGTDLARLALDLHLAAALEEDVDLLGARVVVALGGLPGCKAGLGETLVRGASERRIEQDPDRRAVESR
jgi:hypothetical protein